MEKHRNYVRGFVPYALAAFMVGLVGGLSAVLGPAFVRDIGIDYNNTTWTALAQAMSSAACAPILGKLTDVLGRKKTLLLGISIFILGNTLTALAQNLIFMMIARFVVGIGMAAVAPVVMAYIVTEFPRDKVSKGFSLYMFISSAAVIFGPTAGSLIIDRFGWRAMIWVGAAISAAVFLACLPFRERSVPTRGAFSGFDSFGAVLVVVFFSLLLCVPSFGQNFGWTSPAFWAVFAAAGVSLAFLIFAERRAENPILPGDFLLRKSFVFSVIALFLTQGLLQANMTNTIIFVNYTQPENAALSGYAISVMYLGMSLGAVALGPLADRFEPKNVLTGSFTLTALGCAALLLFTAATSPLLLMGTLGILGLGLGGNATIFMKVVLSDLPARQAGSGTGTYGLFRDLAAPFGVAVFLPMFTNRITADISAGIPEAAAAVEAIRFLSVTEIICVILGIGVVRLLPRLKKA